jgi:hypothetical protein
MTKAEISRLENSIRICKEMLNNRKLSDSGIKLYSQKLLEAENKLRIHKLSQSCFNA